MKIRNLQKRTVYVGEPFDDLKTFCKRENMPLNDAVARSFKAYQVFAILMKKYLKRSADPSQMTLPLDFTT